MSSLGTAYVQIVPSAQGISGSITRAVSPEAQAAGTSAGRSIATNIGTTLSSTGGAMMKAGGIATALSLPLIAGVKKSMDSYNIQASAENKLIEIYKTRMGVSDKAAQKTMDLAGALQKQGVVGDEVTLSGAQQLATFAKYPDTVNKLLPAMDNLLVQQKGVNATSADSVSVANMMGKVMSGQVGALKRVGITFDENSEKILKNGTEQEKAAELAKVITQNVGNMNETFGQTDAGKIQQMKNSMSDLSEKVGGVLAPALADLATFISTNIIPKVSSFLSFLSANPIFAKIAIGITGVLAVGGPLLILLGSIVSAAGTLATTIGAVGGAAVAPIAGFVALGAALAAMWAKSETLRNAVQGLINSVVSALTPIIQTIMAHVQMLLPILGKLAEILGNALGTVIQTVTPIISTLISVIGSFLGPILSVVVGVIKTFVGALQAIGTAVAPVFAKIQSVVGPVCAAVKKHLNFSSVAAAVTGVFNRIKSVITGAVNAIRSVVTSVVNAVKKVFNFSGLAAKVGGVFKSIKDKISKPITAAQNLVKGVVDKIKGILPLKIGKIFPNLKLPHISVSGGKAPFGIAGKGSLPKFKITWNAKAMDNPYMFSDATLFGAGEKGDEILYGRASLMRDISEAVNGAGQSQNVNITNYITVDGAERPEEFVQRFVRQLKLEMRTV